MFFNKFKTIFKVYFISLISNKHADLTAKV